MIDKAAATELLAALKALLVAHAGLVEGSDEMDECEDAGVDPDCERARRAIAKAEGQPGIIGPVRTSTESATKADAVDPVQAEGRSSHT